METASRKKRGIETMVDHNVARLDRKYREMRRSGARGVCGSVEKKHKIRQKE